MIKCRVLGQSNVIVVVCRLNNFLANESDDKMALHMNTYYLTLNTLVLFYTNKKNGVN